MPRLLLILFLPLLALNLRGEKTQFSLKFFHDGEPLQYAVATLTPLDFPIAALPLTNEVIVQQNQEYDPYVTVVMVGSETAFPNRDDVQHHIYSVSKPKRFEKPLYASGTSETVVFDKVGVVTLGCNIHDWMLAYVYVVDTPWYAKSDSDGSAVIKDLSPGRYRLAVWHPRIKKTLEKEITLKPGPNPLEEINLNLKRDRRIRRAPAGRADGY